MMKVAKCIEHPRFMFPVGGVTKTFKESITDGLVLDAIAAHSWAGHGHNPNGPLSRCLRSADLLAPVREWNGMKKLRSVVCAGRADEAALLECRWLIPQFGQIRIPIPESKSIPSCRPSFSSI
ncbi:MAG: hypothetical protein HGA87_06680 [Desulfobulbaceae bacterium]|nr:hypothetical protein [Desulfobulbaceae bacterium]